MASPWSNWVNNLFEGIHKIKFKYRNYNNYVNFAELIISIPTVYKNFKDDLIEYKCLCCNKNYQHKFNEKLMERFINTYKYSKHDSNQVILLLRKGVDPYKDMDNW